MRKLSLGTLLSLITDRRSRPRLILWAGFGVIAFFGLFFAGNALTSTRWFCTDPCHSVHEDNTRAYYNASHSRISCMACHYPKDMNPLAFSIDRAGKLADIPPVVMGTVHMPVNKHSRVALTMPETQCTQCHKMANTRVEARAGLIIDHDVHTKKGITCPTCHNRVAHKEVDKLTLKGNERHEDFTSMTACFRCHTLTGESPGQFTAPGKCSACHKKNFELEPPSHDARNWYNARGDSAGHAKAARAMIEESTEASETWAHERAEFEAHEPKFLARIAYKLSGYDESLKVKVPPTATINECSTCHKASFCSDCHGTTIPHETTFLKAHSTAYAKSDAASCAKCHNETHQPKFAANACSQCHHSMWQPTKGPWATQHGRIIHSKGESAVKSCDRCHERVWCSQCHTSGARPSY